MSWMPLGEKTHSEVKHCIVSKLLTLIDRMKKGPVPLAKAQADRFGGGGGGGGGHTGGGLNTDGKQLRMAQH